MATRKTKGGGRGKRGRRRRFRALFLVAVLAAASYLYYQPLSSYVETKRELAESRAEVEALRQTKAQLEQRLSFSTSEEATRREARRIGFIRPGEQLFIVKGIPDWRREHARSVRGDG